MDVSETMLSSKNFLKDMGSPLLILPASTAKKAARNPQSGNRMVSDPHIG
jgi:hypothetical protein